MLNKSSYKDKKLMQSPKAKQLNRKRFVAGAKKFEKGWIEVE
ncbi:hypothetical protein [Legionella cardiaca]|uniref:Uncharacterized protein n=1 Tax=Legionella cardiaca TaxID=1071983 RepID=A0ABY8AWJ4_9GAMM|nr:hypothetical protein [Legionella cardiaca]WED43507.1 hypothetical protein PXX05_01675 [Legionella cardiaca]